MNNEELVMQVSAALKERIPEWFNEVATVCATQNCGLHTQWQPILPFRQKITDFAAYINCGMLHKVDFQDAVCDIVRLNLWQGIAFGYIRSNPKCISVSHQSVLSELRSALQQIGDDAIIVDFGTFLWGINPSVNFVHNDDSWTFAGRKIISIPMPAVPRWMDRSLVVIDKKDAPCWDGRALQGPSLHINGAMSIDDEYNLLESLYYIDNNGDPCMCINNTLPLMCKPNSNAIQIQITKYNFETN